MFECHFKVVLLSYLQIRIVIADIVIALIFGTFWALAFEYPGIKIEEVIFNRSATTFKKEKTALGRKRSITGNDKFTIKNPKWQ